MTQVWAGAFSILTELCCYPFDAAFSNVVGRLNVINGAEVEYSNGIR